MKILALACVCVGLSGCIQVQLSDVAAAACTVAKYESEAYRNDKRAAVRIAIAAMDEACANPVVLVEDITSAIAKFKSVIKR